VPVCPLCNKPIPLKKGEVPDVVVGRHIDSDCQSDPAKERRKVSTTIMSQLLPRNLICFTFVSFTCVDFKQRDAWL